MTAKQVGHPSWMDTADLEFTPEEMSRMGRVVLEWCVEHVAALAESPSRGDVAGAPDICRSMRESAPEQGRPLEGLLQQLFEEWIPRSFTTPGPGYFAYVPGGGLFPTALADLISNTTNRFSGIFHAAPCLSQVEGNVLDWIRDWMQFPASARGTLTPGGSMSTFAAVVAAREWLTGTDLRNGVLYRSREGHHSIDKAARLAGILGDRIREIAVDDEFRMRPDDLEAAIAADRERGLRPFLVVSSAGTVNTGAVDPLDVIADVCARERLWHHIDGAYGGFFHMVPELRPLLAGLSRADSLSLDPHKGLFLPYGTGALLVRDGEKLAGSHAATAGYLPDPIDDDLYDASRYGPALSRPFRGLRVWLPVQLYGVAKIRAAVAEKRALALQFHESLAQVPGLQIVAPPHLSLFAFRLTWDGATPEQESEATRELVERVTNRGKVMLSGCTIEGRFLARICVLSFRTREAQARTCAEHVAEETAAILAECAT